MTSTELARLLSDASLAHRAAGSDKTLSRLEALAREAANHVARVGEGTVDHIVLSSVPKLIVPDVRSVEEVLKDAGWRWLP